MIMSPKPASKQTLTRTRTRRSPRAVMPPCPGCGAPSVELINGIAVCDVCAETASGRIEVLPSVGALEAGDSKALAAIREELTAPKRGVWTLSLKKKAQKTAAR